MLVPGWRPGANLDLPLGTFIENWHWRAHHPFCQAHFQDVLTGTPFPHQPGYGGVLR